MSILILLALVVGPALSYRIGKRHGQRIGFHHGKIFAGREAEAERRARTKSFPVEIVGGAADGKRLRLSGIFHDVSFPVHLGGMSFDEARYRLDHAVYKPEAE